MANKTAGKKIMVGIGWIVLLAVVAVVVYIFNPFHGDKTLSHDPSNYEVRYQVNPAPALLPRLMAPADWVATSQSNNVKWWGQDYTNVIADIFPWVPDQNLLQKTLMPVFYEYGVETNGSDDPNYATNYLTAVTGAVNAALTGREGPFSLAWDTNAEYNGKNELIGQLHKLLSLADQESRGLFAQTAKDLEPRTIGLPSLTSSTRPVAVDLTSYQEEDVADTTEQSPADSGKPAGTNQVSSSKPNSSDAKGQESSGESVSDFDPDQQVTLNLSTVLDSASTLDRIDYVSTYVYLYPWPLSLDGPVVLEREFWRNFFSINAGRDPLEQTNGQLRNDIFAALDNLRVKVIDLSTTVTNVLVNLGSEQQNFSEQNQDSLGATVPIEGASVTGQASRTSGQTATESSVLQQQLDQRSTFIDSEGDFFRITQRGMRSVDLAGRFKDILTLHIPSAANSIHLLILNASTNAADTNNLFDVKDVSQPLYSEVKALTFSVVVARQTTGLRPATAEQYGLEDPRNAGFIVGVTGPKLIKLWHWPRYLNRLTTQDLEMPGRAQGLSAQFPGDPEPAPIFLASYDDSNPLMRKRYLRLLAEFPTNSLGHLSVKCDPNTGFWAITSLKQQKQQQLQKPWTPIPPANQLSSASGPHRH